MSQAETAATLDASRSPGVRCGDQVLIFEERKWRPLQPHEKADWYQEEEAGLLQWIK